MRKMQRAIAILGLFVFVQNNCVAELIRHPHPGVRATGMGGAFVAISDDANAIWYNPAGLARVRGGHFNIFDFTGGGDSLETLGRVSGAIFLGQTNEFIKMGQQMARLSVRSTLTIPYFSIALFESFNSYSDLSAIATFDQLDASTLTNPVDLYMLNDVGANAGFAIPLGALGSVGANVRAFHRTSVDASMTLAELLARTGTTASSFSDGALDALTKISGAGLGVALNVGAMVEVPLPSDYPRWTIGGVIEDVGDTSYMPLGGPNLLQPTRMNYHLGTAFRYALSGSRTANIAFDYRNLFQDTALVKKLHFGAEYRNRVVGFRLGVNQGYLTGGVSFEFPPHTRLHLSTYASELGAAAFDKAQRWYLAQLIVGFDPN